MISASHDNVFPLYLFLSSGMNAAEKTPQHWQGPGYSDLGEIDLENY